MKLAPKLFAWLIAIPLVACNQSIVSVDEQIGPSWPNLNSKVEFSEDDKEILRAHGIATFRGKLILNAQPPITKSQLRETESYLSDPIPDDLNDLWKLSFGGSLDYDYEVSFGEHVYPASLREIFYKDSDHYHDIIGWIEAESGGEPRLSIVPFAGYEYLERAYLILNGADRGKVLFWAQGLPPAWKGRLNEDSITIPARSVAEIFDQLYLSADPFVPQPEDSYPNGLEMVEKVKELKDDYPELARKVTELIKENVFNWRNQLPNQGASGPYSALQHRAMRLALSHAAAEDDVTIIDEFRRLGLPFDMTLRAESGLLPEAMRQGSSRVVLKIIDHGLDVGTSKIIYIKDSDPDVVNKLIKRGTLFDIEAILNLAEEGLIDSALNVATSNSLFPSLGKAEIIREVEERADREDKSAKDIEEGTLSSYATPAEHRRQASNLREFAKEFAR